ncbi:MAG: hypothetical protein FJZ87_15825 [Chloroflexi bacterium]|nr:hypothetical protein [Chloroflexota bacterium]
MAGIFHLILGTSLLIAGRKLFWLFVAAAGFFAGVQLTDRFWHGPEWLSILVGLGLGILLALLAMALKSLAIGLAGFLLGGSAVVALAEALGVESGMLIWVLYLVGGIVGIILITTVFDWALIGISSFAGASMIVQFLELNRPLAGLVIVILLVVGIFIQSGQKRREIKRDD